MSNQDAGAKIDGVDVAQVRNLTIERDRDGTSDPIIAQFRVVFQVWLGVTFWRSGMGHGGASWTRRLWMAQGNPSL